MERRRTVILSWLVIAFFVMVAKTQTSQSLSSMSSSSVPPRTLGSSSSSSAMSLSSVTPRTLASSSSSLAMSSSPVTPRTLASSSSLPSPSTPPVTPATNPPASSPSTLPVTPATKPPECSDYKFLSDPSISATYRRDDLYYVCKDNFKPGWHRFGGEAGNQMADTCVKMCHCGVVYPGWLSGGHPSVEDGAVVRRVCFGRGCTCHTFVYISVRNCSGFYVYNLTSIPSSSCYYGYCASTGFEEPTFSATGKFTNIVARWPGSCHDSHIFRSSNICQFLEENHNSLDDGIVLGDSGYACSPFLMTPYANPEIPQQEAYNSAHTKTRVVIEQTYGRWKRRFHVLHSEIRMAPEKVCLIIGACAVLHNIAVLLNEPMDDADLPDEVPEVEVYDGPQQGLTIRNHICNTFFG